MILEARPPGSTLRSAALVLRIGLCFSNGATVLRRSRSEQAVAQGPESAEHIFEPVNALP